jgi:hypothetical protein
MLKTFGIALLVTAMSVGLAEAKGRSEGSQSRTESLGVLSNRPTGSGDMRLRSGKSDVPKGSVVPRLLKYV